MWRLEHANGWFIDDFSICYGPRPSGVSKVSIGNKLQADALSREIERLTAQDRAGGLDPQQRRRLAELLMDKQRLRVRPKVTDS